MRRPAPVAALLAALLAGCGGSDSPPDPAPRGGAAEVASPANAAPAATPVVTREEVFALLRAAGYDPQTRETPRFSRKMEQGLATLPEGPVTHFMLGVDGEGMIAFEFASVDMARRMARTQEDGFRYRNWFFGGAITFDLTRGMQRALGE